MKALALLSGGLDSMLAVKIIQREGIEVLGVVFKSPFFGAEKAREAAQKLGIKLFEEDISKELIEVVKSPPHGYGRYLNPCLDCHSLMLRKAGKIMEEIGASFLVTGEVLGERPKSQNRQALKTVEKESGYAGLVLRPLSAKLLEPTEPEKQGWVKQENLLAISGRSRLQQFKLAEEFGLQNYPTPAGGCLLTDPQFSNRLRALWSWRGDILIDDLYLLKIGRHFWLAKSWLVVGRNEKENQLLKNLRKKEDFLIKSVSAPGPLGLLRGKPDQKELKEASLIVIRYGQARDREEAEALIEREGKEELFKFKRKEWLKYL
jgi:tRNA U34 2-thiouridine synthase MnmA/TrmU